MIPLSLTMSDIFKRMIPKTVKTFCHNDFMKIDHINLMITLIMIAISSLHCTTVTVYLIFSWYYIKGTTFFLFYKAITFSYNICRTIVTNHGCKVA
jgi:hypothetical protein